MSNAVEEIVRRVTAEAAGETDSSPEAKLSGAVKWPIDVSIGRGLEGAVAAVSSIGYVNGQKGWLVYRGYNCFDLALHSTYEETAYLLLFGKLPAANELDDFNRKLAGFREVPPQVVDVMAGLPVAEMHPMAALLTAISLLGAFDPMSDETSLEGEMEISLKLIAQTATLVGQIARMRAGKKPVAPDTSLSHAANFLYMMSGKRPDEQTARVMDISLILHADHGMNASTFTTMVVNSTLSDMYSSVVSGIASLKGSLHGGANERVLYQLEEIGKPENTIDWFTRAKASKTKVMGMGHRVYKAYDPRGRILGPLAGLMTEGDPEASNLFAIARELERTVTADLGKTKKIYPNVDFYSGLLYKAMGIETAIFTPIFAVSRVAGWTARALEYLSDNRIFRPRGIYAGKTEQVYVPLEKR